MNDEEKLLKRFRVMTPSEDLDQRMGQLFTGVPEERPQFVLRRPIPLWGCIAACALCALCAWFIRPRNDVPFPGASEPATIQYVVEIRNNGASLFDWTQHPGDMDSRPVQWETRVYLPEGGAGRADVPVT